MNDNFVIRKYSYYTYFIARFNLEKNAFIKILKKHCNCVGIDLYQVYRKPKFSFHESTSVLSVNIGQCTYHCALSI